MAQSEWSPQYWKAQFKIGIQNYHTNNQAHSIILTLKIITTIFTARQTELYVSLGLIWHLFLQLTKNQPVWVLSLVVY